MTAAPLPSTGEGRRFWSSSGCRQESPTGCARPSGAPDRGRRSLDRVNASRWQRPMSTQPSKQLEVVPNPHPDRDYEVSLEIPEFTCLCPRTGQPDFATIRIRYVPDQRLVELKSIKLYVWSYRNEGAFHEDVTNRILNDFVAVAAPRWIEVVGDFSVRGGIKTVVRATHGKRTDLHDG